MEPVAVYASPARRLVFAGLLMWVMVAATAMMVTIPVLASFLIDDFGINRTQLGSIGAVGSILAALSSPSAGRLADRIGGRNTALVVLAGAAIGAFLFAIAPVFGALFAGAIIAFVTGAGGNPGTNKLIAAHLGSGRRGLVTGLKQTGPQVGTLLAGLLAPWGALALGWRPTMAVMAGLLVVPIPFLLRVVPADPPRLQRSEESLATLPVGIWWVTVYGGLLGFGGSAVFLLPLFVEETLGQTPRVAGVAAALVGGVAVAGRLQWARLVERRDTSAPTLAVLAILAVVAMGLMLVSITSGIAWMWAGTIVLGLSASSWTAVGSMAVIAIAGASGAGRASGAVWFGFLAGHGLGPPLYGFAVDETGSYALMWWLALVSYAIAAGVALAWMRSHRRQPA